MTSVRRRFVTRLAASVLAPGLVAAGALAGASTATADDKTDRPGGATATLDGLKTYDKVRLVEDGGNEKTIRAGLFEMTVDGGGTLKTYCIDIANPARSNARYGEVSWDESSLNDNADAGKILWVLEHSYPQVNNLSKLAKAADLKKGRTLTPQTAAAGTQVAIWRFSDDANVTAVNPAAEKLADYLTKAAKDVAEPQASLKLSPAAVSGKAGERIGPVTVHTNAQSVSVGAPMGADAAGVKVVNSDGEPLETTTDGGELYFQVPESAQPGSATVSVQASTQIPVGRAFTSLGKDKSQTMILAGSSESTVTATTTVTWADKGAIPAVTAKKNCAEGGVDITVTNKGDKTFTFSLAGERHNVPAGETGTVTVPVGEDQAYDITITGPHGFEKNFTGVLDCETKGTGGDEGTTPQTGSGGPVGDSDADSGDDTDLAATGGSGNTTMIVGAALGLLVVGGAAMLIVRKRRLSTAPTTGGGDSED